MNEYFASLTGLEKIYLGCAVFGGGLFILRMAMMLLGADQPDMDADLDMDVDAGDAGGADVDDGGLDDADMDAGLRLLTVQGFTAFIMMFGLTGYGVSRSSALGSVVTVTVGCAAGVGGMWLVAKGFAVMRSLQSSGTMNVHDAIGEQGSVYLTIPADGIGKIQVTVSGRLKVMDAVSQEKVEIKTGERVSVAAVVNERLLSVSKVQA